MVIEPGFAASLPVEILAITRGRDDDDILEPRQPADRTRCLVTGHAREPDVENDDVGMKLRGRVHGIGPVECETYVVPLERQRDLEHVRRVDVVVHDEASQATRRRGGSVARRRWALRSTGGLPGQPDDKLAASTAALAVRLAVPAMELGDPADERQAEPEPALRTVERAIVLREQIEDVGKQTWRDAAAGVCDSGHDLLRFLGGGD